MFLVAGVSGSALVFVTATANALALEQIHETALSWRHPAHGSAERVSVWGRGIAVLTGRRKCLGAHDAVEEFVVAAEPVLEYLST